MNEIDYTTRTWGHNIEMIRLQDDQSVTAFIWHWQKVSVGDTIKFRNQHHVILIFEITELEWMRDPDDMYKVRMVLACECGHPKGSHHRPRFRPWVKAPCSEDDCRCLAYSQMDPRKVAV